MGAAPPDITAFPAPRTGSAEVDCPLCGYNLRGLIEPRCPECGYRFEWSELTDPARRHPYLFEQTLRRPAWSFFRTLLGGLRPWRFWREVRPTQPRNLRRLLIYWFLCALPLVLLVAADLAVELHRAAAVNTWQRASLTAFWNGGGTWMIGSPDREQWKAQVRNRHGSLSGFLDQVFPQPWTLRFFGKTLNDWNARLATWVLVWLAWPWLIGLILMIFRQSMQQAKVRFLHVMRCILYSHDGMFWVGTVGLIIIVSCHFEIWQLSSLAHRLPPPPLDWWLHSRALSSEYKVIFWLGVIGSAFMAVRLCFAYARYLRFRHPARVVAAAYVVAALLLCLISIA